MSVFFGEPEGVKIGTIFPDRQSLVDAGIHRTLMRGIDGNSDEGSSAIVLSGGYEDDLDFGDFILYTGEGGNQNGKQVDHQSFETPGNAGLKISYEKQLPIRVIRGFNHVSPFSPKKGYKYCGLFEVADEPFMEVGKSGFRICRFKLRQISEGEGMAVKSGCIVTLHSPRLANDVTYVIEAKHPHLKTISLESKLAQALLNKRAGDSASLGDNQYTIVDVYKYLS
jgi:hypothetical protein